MTAIGNIDNYNKIKNEFNLEFKDIQYKEGIIEFLNNYREIDIIIINEKIPGNLEINELIDQIIKVNGCIKIILISKKNYKNVYKNIEEFDLKKLREILQINEYKQIYRKVNIKSNYEKSKKGKVICVIGSNGVGKSIFTIMLSRKFINKKIVVIDFDFFNRSLHTILDVEEYSNRIKSNSIKGKNQIVLKNNNIDILDFIIKTKYKNIDLISGLNLIFDFENEKNIEKIERIVKKLKSNYDLIIFDTSIQTFFDYTKKIMEISDENIMISGANSLEIKKTSMLLKIYNEEWKISKEKIRLIFNKCTKNSVDSKIIKKVFKGYKIIGKIKLSDYYDIVINNYTEKINEVEEELKSIGDKILKEQNKIQKIVKN